MSVWKLIFPFSGLSASKSCVLMLSCSCLQHVCVPVWQRFRHRRQVRPNRHTHRSHPHPPIGVMGHLYGVEIIGKYLFPSRKIHVTALNRQEQRKHQVKKENKYMNKICEQIISVVRSHKYTDKNVVLCTPAYRFIASNSMRNVEL